MDNFSDIFIRFFLRNIALLHTMNRYNEIEYIQNYDFSSSLSSLPVNLQNQMNDILNNKNSEFSDIYHEIGSTPVDKTFQKCSDIMSHLK